MKVYRHKHEQGGISGSMIAIILLVILVLAAGSFAIWAYVNYDDQKTNVEGKIKLAVAEAEKTQSEEDEKKFADLVVLLQSPPC